ncbi:MAG: hypothetical protein GEV03_27005 [Streptosporangiales bacterium]|nr:hypothetical protein [Streptosporangiales bacterium]
MQVSPDPVGGWNLHLVTQRFTFAPEHAGGDPRAGEGHAHVYVDDEKVGRAYGPWFYLPADAVSPGRHTVRVTLTANDHATYAVDDREIEDTAAVTGQEASGEAHGGGDHSGDGDHSGSTPGEDAAAADKTITVRIADGEVRPAPGRIEVDRGSRVRIQITGDEADELHVHGYDKTAELRPGKPAVVQFVADQTGLFEVETHHGGLMLFQLVVR